MKAAKRKKLEAADWRVGTVDEFLGTAAKRERLLTSTQTRMLRNVRDGYSYDRGAEGMSGYAGAQTTMYSLVRRELLEWRGNDLVITAAGRAALRKGIL